MAKMNYADIANKIIAQIGEENVLTVSHCMTRLRFTVKDFSKVSLDDIKKISGVIGAGHMATNFIVACHDRN